MEAEMNTGFYVYVSLTLTLVSDMQATTMMVNTLIPASAHIFAIRSEW